MLAPARLALLGAAATTILTACSFVGVRPRPDVVEPATRWSCTDRYWLPGADAAAIVALVPTSIWLSHEGREAVEEAHARGEYDAQDGFAVALPYFFAAVAAIPLSISALYGSLTVRSCREARTWVASVDLPPDAGRPGASCVPVYGGGGHCDAGARCERGRCVAIPPEEIVVASCGAPLGALNAPMDYASRRARWLALAEECKEFLRVSCSRRPGDSVDSRPACSVVSP